jgi:hypothetical protein
MTQELSPAAQAVLDAANGKSSYGPDDVLNESRWIAAAALRAAADQVVPEESTKGKMFAWQQERLQQRLITRQRFLAIADELEAQ